MKSHIFKCGFRVLQKYLFYLELITLAGEARVALKSMKSTLTSVVKAPVKIANTIAKVGKKGVIKIISLMNVTKDFITNLPKYLDALLEWLSSKLLHAKVYLDQMYAKYFKQIIRKRLDKLGIRPTKFNEATDTFTCCPIKSVFYKHH